MQQQVQLARSSSEITLRGSVELVAEFFGFAINSILYQRGVYPADTFVSVAKYGLSTQVTADEGLKTYLASVVRQLAGWLAVGAVKKLVVVIAGAEASAGCAASAGWRRRPPPRTASARRPLCFLRAARCFSRRAPADARDARALGVSRRDGQGGACAGVRASPLRRHSRRRRRPAPRPRRASSPPRQSCAAAPPRASSPPRRSRARSRRSSARSRHR